MHTCTQRISKVVFEILEGVHSLGSSKETGDCNSFSSYVELIRNQDFVRKLQNDLILLTSCSVGRYLLALIVSVKRDGIFSIEIFDSYELHVGTKMR